MIVPPVATGRAQPVRQMIVLLTTLIALACMGFAVHQWWRGYDLIAIGFITFALLMAGIAIKAAKDDQNADAPVLQQPRSLGVMQF